MRLIHHKGFDSVNNLKDLLLRVDGKGYKAYKSLQGSYKSE
jgi:hypothetical protein